MRCRTCDLDIGNGRGPLAPFCSVHCRDIGRLKEENASLRKQAPEVIREQALLIESLQAVIHDEENALLETNRKISALCSKLRKSRQEKMDEIAQLREENERLRKMVDHHCEIVCGAEAERDRLKKEHERLKELIKTTDVSYCEQAENGEWVPKALSAQGGEGDGDER